MATKTTHFEESALCRRAARGDTQARHDLYLAHATGIMTLATRMLSRPSCAEEVVQDTFMKAFDQLGRFEGKAKFSTWLRRIAINECLQRLRSPWHQRGQSFVEAQTPGQHTDEQIDLLRALATLDPISRAVVWLHDVEGYTHVEIGEMMDKTTSFSKSRLARGHKTLRAALNQHDEFSPCVPILNTSCQ
ncbi:MAG: RNA polymerase sigma factor [Gammaproteobacteria bacterium]